MKWVIDTLVPFVMLSVTVVLLLAFLFVFREIWQNRDIIGK